MPSEGKTFVVDKEATNGEALASTRKVVAAILAFLHEVTATPGLEAHQVVQYHSDQLRRAARLVNLTILYFHINVGLPDFLRHIERYLDRLAADGLILASRVL